MKIFSLSVMVAGLLAAVPGGATELVPASGVAATAADKCPMHERFGAMHKQSEPCPAGAGHDAAMHDKCETHRQQDCLEKHGKPCPLPKDACDTVKRREKTVK